MPIRVACNHNTSYKFDRPISLFPHVVRLRPALHSRTPIHAYSLKVFPEKHFLNWQQDAFGNYMARLVFPEKTSELRIEVEVIADMTAYNPFDFFVEDYAETFPFSYNKLEHTELAPYFQKIITGPLLEKWLKKVDRSKKNTNDFLVDVNNLVQKSINYSVRMEVGVQSCETTLQRALGSCRDSAWLLVQIFRHLGVAARFVSGYLIQLSSDEKSLDGPSGPEADFTDLHAWTEVYIPGAGWIGLDPTSGLLAGEGHIPLACTPHPLSASPVTGATEACEVEFEHSNTVTRIHEDPRVTKPYSDEQWLSIDALGQQVEEDLVAGDVRLTMGGEPTFVSIDDMDGAEWNIAALGDKKRELAEDLLLRLQHRFAPGAALHYGQGKWYPGEVLPRWALGCFWREDGVPVWHDPKWLAQEDGDHQYDTDDAQRFMDVLCRYLSLDSEVVQTAYEDVYYYLWKEGTLPENVDALDSKLDNPQERSRLRQLFEHGI
ncbi:MAG: transglutaminase family protein, partial [Desulfuromusa sp.]|nr:transglutaminase family protein [Desulfuromusa sp.]